MIKLTVDEVREFLRPYEGDKVTLNDIRREMHIEKGTEAFDDIRNIMFYLGKVGFVRSLGKRNGEYKVVKKVRPVPVFSVKRERRTPFELIFPKDRDTEMEFPFAEDIVIREGDCVLIAGQSNFGKTTLAMNFCGENIDSRPVLLGNEFTHIVGEEAETHEPTPRFLNRLDDMDWVEWVNGTGEDKFTLLPVYEDFAENIIRDRINIIDWVNLPGEYYMISPLMEQVKRAVGRGILILVIQKNPGAEHGRGGALSRDFADLELLIDEHTKYESRITVGKVKEYTKSVSGKSWAFGIWKGVKITNVREVVKCSVCHGKGWGNKGPCDSCDKLGWVSK